MSRLGSGEFGSCGCGVVRDAFCIELPGCRGYLQWGSWREWPPYLGATWGENLRGDHSLVELRHVHGSVCPLLSVLSQRREEGWGGGCTLAD